MSQLIIIVCMLVVLVPPAMAETEPSQRAVDGLSLSPMGESALEPAIAPPSPGGLPSAIRATLAHHPALRGKSAEIDASRYAIDTAKAARYPTVSIELGYGAMVRSDQDSDPATLGSLRLQQPLWAFGKIDRAIEHAELRYGSEQADLQRIRQELIEQTVQRYATIEGLRQRLTIADDNIIAHQLLLDQIISRQQGRMASEADVTVAKSRLIQATAQQATLQGELNVAIGELRASTQIDVNSQPPIRRERLHLLESEQLRRQIFARSPILAHKMQQKQQQQALVAREEVALLPTVALRVDQPLEKGQGDNTQALLLLEAQLDGFGFAARGRTAEARARLQASEHDWQVAKNELNRRVDNLLATRTMQQALQQGWAESVAAVVATLDSYTRQYHAGKKSWLEVLNMQREVTDQRLQQAQADHQWLLATLELWLLAGGNLDE